MILYGTLQSKKILLNRAVWYLSSIKFDQN